MLRNAAILWVIGLVTFVPYGTYYLFFEATRDQYALLIVSLLFWVFGYWSLAGPLLLAAKARAVFRALEMAKSREELEKIIQSPAAREAAVDFIATENHIPRFVARRVVALLIKRFAQSTPP